MSPGTALGVLVASGAAGLRWPLGGQPMPDITLGVTEQRALHAIFSLEQPLGGRARQVALLEQVSRVIRCDALGIGTVDDTGLVVDEISLPRDHLDWLGPQVCDGPLPFGILHWSRDARHEPLLAQVGLRDTIAAGFRSGPDHVVQISLDRWHRPFEDRDVAVLSLLAPALGRLLRDRPPAALPASLTDAERRVLQLVATGLSNAEVAHRLFVAPSTVRKHLENSYRKLGVTNRVAAIRRFEGSVPDDPERGAAPRPDWCAPNPNSR